MPDILSGVVNGSTIVQYFLTLDIFWVTPALKIQIKSEITPEWRQGQVQVSFLRIIFGILVILWWPILAILDVVIAVLLNSLTIQTSLGLFGDLLKYYEKDQTF